MHSLWKPERAIALRSTHAIRVRMEGGSGTLHAHLPPVFAVQRATRSKEAARKPTGRAALAVHIERLRTGRGERIVHTRRRRRGTGVDLELQPMRRCAVAHRRSLGRRIAGCASACLGLQPCPDCAPRLPMLTELGLQIGINKDFLPLLVHVTEGSEAQRRRHDPTRHLGARGWQKCCVANALC